MTLHFNSLCREVTIHGETGVHAFANPAHVGLIDLRPNLHFIEILGDQKKTAVLAIGAHVLADPTRRLIMTPLTGDLMTGVTEVCPSDLHVTLALSQICHRRGYRCLSHVVTRFQSSQIRGGNRAFNLVVSLLGGFQLGFRQFQFGKQPAPIRPLRWFKPACSLSKRVLYSVGSISATSVFCLTIVL